MNERKTKTATAIRWGRMIRLAVVVLVVAWIVLMATAPPVW